MTCTWAPSAVPPRIPPSCHPPLERVVREVVPALLVSATLTGAEGEVSGAENVAAEAPAEMGAVTARPASNHPVVAVRAPPNVPDPPDTTSPGNDALVLASVITDTRVGFANVYPLLVAA